MLCLSPTLCQNIRQGFLVLFFICYIYFFSLSYHFSVLCNFFKCFTLGLQFGHFKLYFPSMFFFFLPYPQIFLSYCFQVILIFYQFSPYLIIFLSWLCFLCFIRLFLFTFLFCLCLCLSFVFSLPYCPPSQLPITFTCSIPLTCLCSPLISPLVCCHLHSVYLSYAGFLCSLLVSCLYLLFLLINFHEKY